MSGALPPGLPPGLIERLLPLLLGARLPAYLEIDAGGQIREVGGALDAYGLARLSPGAAAEEVLPLLLGLLPARDALCLPAVRTESGRFADVHVLPAGPGCWVVLLDVSEAVAVQARFQQSGNELSLLSDRQARILDRFLGRQVAARLVGDPPRQEGERRELSILFADIRGFTGFSERSAPGEVFAALNRYLDAMMAPLEEEGGVVDKIIGDAVMGLFGLAPVGREAAAAAVAAAQEVQRRVAALCAARAGQGEEALGVGIGIATGSVAIGVLGTRERRAFTAIGHHVNLAARLQGQARPGEILMDEETLRRLGAPPPAVYEVSLHLRGMAGPMRAHGLFLPP